MSREKRNYLAQYLLVRDATSGEELGYLGDISKNGFMFIAPAPLKPGQIKEILIENTLVEGEQTDAISVTATIETLWNKPNLNPEMTCVGCSLLQIDTGSRELLENLVSDIKFGNDVVIHRTVG